MYQLGLSLWRTCVPYIVAFLAVQAARLGIKLDNATVTSALITGFGTVYYAVFRFLEHHHDARWGWFLGIAKPPSYHPAPTAPGGSPATAAPASTPPSTPAPASDGSAIDYTKLPEGG
jgi:hypothetical protein